MECFKKNSYHILNTYISDSLIIQNKLNNKIYENVFNKNNIENIIKFYTFFVLNYDYSIFFEIFFNIYSKMICTYMKIFKENINVEFKSKLRKILVEDPDNIAIQYIKNIFFKECMKNINDLREMQHSLEKNYKKNIKEIKIADGIIVRDVLSIKDIELNDQNNNIYIINFDSPNNEEDKSSSEIDEICIYCKQPLNNYYGKVCFMIQDYFIDILKNKEQKLRRKKTRIVTCKHKIHYNCYSQLEIENIKENFIKDGFECPKCKKLSNIIICDFNCLVGNNNNILQGMKYNNEKNNDFYANCDKNIKGFQNLIIYNKNFFEIYCSRLLKKDVIINSINANSNIFENIYELLVNDFDSFTIYYNVTNYKEDQVNIWKNILLAIRLLCKYKIINYIDFFVSKFNSLCIKFKNFDFSGLDNIEISFLINQFIFCLFIIYDLNEETIKTLFQNYILEYLFIYYCFLNNKGKIKLNEFICEKNRILLKKIFDIYNSKYKICFLLYNENKIVKLNFVESIQILKRKHYKNNDNLIKIPADTILKETKYEPKFNIIELPKNYNDFISKYMNRTCINCNEKLDYYICLICGSKICNSPNCVSERRNGKKIHSLYAHSKECSGGNALFIRTARNFKLLLPTLSKIC